MSALIKIGRCRDSSRLTIPVLDWLMNPTPWPFWGFFLEHVVILGKEYRTNKIRNTRYSVYCVWRGRPESTGPLRVDWCERRWSYWTWLTRLRGYRIPKTSWLWKGLQRQIKVLARVTLGSVRVLLCHKQDPDSERVIEKQDSIWLIILLVLYHSSDFGSGGYQHGHEPRVFFSVSIAQLLT